MGFGKGAVDVGCNTLLQWQRGDQAGPYLNGLHFAFGLGSFVSPILLAQVLGSTHDIYWVFWIIAMVITPVIVWLWLLPSPHPAAHAGNGGSGPVPVLPVLLIVLAFFLYVGAEVGFSSWLYTYAITLHLADAVRAAYLTSGFWALFTLGRLLGIWIATRVGARPILFFDLAGCLVSVALIWLAPRSLSLLWAGSLGLGFSMASIFPTILILAGEQLRVTGTITGWFLLGAGAGGMVLPWWIGNAFTTTGPSAMTALVFSDLVLNLLVLLLFVYGHPARERSASTTTRES
jgi:FHS family Na+ dependent glucose MFS transporter 1